MVVECASQSVESRRNWVFLIPMLGNVMLVPFTFSEGRNPPKDCSNIVR